MGAKQSKRSVDITSSPNKTGDSETINEGEGRVVKIGDVDVKAATNGTVPHTEKELEVGEKEKDENAKDLTVEKSVESKEKDVEEIKESKEVKENGVSDSEELKTPDSDSTGDNLNESAVSEKSPESAPEGKEGEATPETKKQKEKKKKKWSFRSISFSKKDKSKPSKEAEKNGEVKEVAEENAEDAKSPTSESPKTEKPETPAEIAPVLNGDASKEEIVDTPKPEAVPTEETKKEEPKLEETKPEEPKVETKPDEPEVEPKIEETNNSELVESAPKEPIPVKTPVEETKEVRNEEVPPPLPSSNPPSSLTAFAESTKADILNTETIDLLQVTSVVDPVLEKEIVEPLLEQNIVEPKQELNTTSPSESLPISSSKCETEPNLKSPNLPKSEPLIESVDSEKSLGDLIADQQKLPLKSELTQKSEKSDTLVELKSEDKPRLTESATVVMQSQICEPSSESSLQENEKCESKATEEPLVQEMISALSSEPSDSSIPLVVDEPLPNTIELNLKPLPRVENEQNLESTDLQSKTELDTQPPIEAEVSEIPEPVEVKKIPENITLISQEDSIEPSPIEIASQESLSSGFIQTSEENNKAIVEDLKGPQLTPVELVIEDAKPQIIEQLPSEQSLNFSEESESIDLPPPESDHPPVGFIEEIKSDLPPAPPAPITSEECLVDLPSPTDLPPPSVALVDPTDSLQDISTESLPSLPEPLSENLAEPMSLPPVDSLPEPIATDCLPPETASVTTNSIPLEYNLPKAESEPLTAEPNSLVSEPVSLVAEPVSLVAEPVSLATESATLPTEPILLATEIITVATDSIPSESDPIPPTECPPVLTNGSVNGLVSPGEASPTTNGGSILLGEAAPLKQIPQEVSCDVGKEEGDKAAPATTAEVPAVEE